jgi:hypothetical protein
MSDADRHKTVQPSWLLPVASTLACILIFLPLLLIPGAVDDYLFFVFPAIFIVGICSLAYAAVRKRLRIALLVIVFWALSAFLFFHHFQIRTFTRWTLFSHRYQTQVLAQPEPLDGSLKHMEWDGWGWAGMDFSVFLVFDPTDALNESAAARQLAKVPRLPCAVSDVRKMDPHWYIVIFDAYIDQSSWTNCR